MLFETPLPPLPPRHSLRPVPPPHSAGSIGQHRKLPGTRDMAVDQLARIVQNGKVCHTATGATKTKTASRSSELDKENRGISLETTVKLLGIKKEEADCARSVKEYHRSEVKEAHVERPRHPFPVKSMRICGIYGSQLLPGELLDMENQQSDMSIGSTCQSNGTGNRDANGTTTPALSLRSVSTPTTVKPIRSSKHRARSPPLPALPVSEQQKTAPNSIGYVINSNREYLEEVAKRYSRTFGKTGKVFIKIHGIDGMNLSKECTGTDDQNDADRYVYLVLECDGQKFSSKKFSANPGHVHLSEEFTFPVRAGCKLNVQLALAPSPVSLPKTGIFYSFTNPNIAFRSTAGTNGQPEGKASGRISSDTGSSGYSAPPTESSGTSTGGSFAQTCLKLGGPELVGLSIPKSTAAFQRSWDLSRECIVPQLPQEPVRPLSIKRKTTSHSLWQKLKKRSLKSSSTRVSAPSDLAEEVSVTQTKLVVVGNVKASMVVWPYSGDWTPSGFDECVRILTCDGVSSLNHLIRGWMEHGKEYIGRNPNMDLTGILGAASVLGNLMVLGNASVRGAGSVYWKRRSFAMYPPHLLSLPISDHSPTHIHQAFDLRLCIAIEAPFDTPIQDIHDGLWHPTANAFRICFRKSATDFKEEETVELSLDSLTTANEWVNLLRGIVGRLQEMEF